MCMWDSDSVSIKDTVGTVNRISTIVLPITKDGQYKASSNNLFDKEN